jgi:uncharacterized cupredoxin-like copper-binding protein
MSTKNTILIILVLVVLGAGVFLMKGDNDGDDAMVMDSDNTMMENDHGLDSDLMMQTKELVVELSALNNSGQSGKAIFSEDGGKTKVIIDITSGAEGVSQPIHIHKGSCAELGSVLYPLSSVVDGRSETVLDLSLEDIKSQLPLAVNVHKSADALNEFVACGDILFGDDLMMEEGSNMEESSETITEEENEAMMKSDVKEFSMDSFYEMENGKPHPQFSVKEITVKKGDKVKINITNTKGDHSFKIDEFDVFAETPLNETVSVEFTADKTGEFVYYCTKPGHRENGHWGTLKVVE